MPRRSARRRIVSASGPSSSSRTRAASTISRARGVRPLAALEAIAGPEAVAQGSVDGDVRRPRERADEPDGGKARSERDDAQRDRPREAMGQVVEGDGTAVELAALEACAHSEE